jgi:hypothetical protein
LRRSRLTVAAAFAGVEDMDGRREEEFAAEMPLGAKAIAGFDVGECDAFVMVLERCRFIDDEGLGDAVKAGYGDLWRSRSCPALRGPCAHLPHRCR